MGQPACVDGLSCTRLKPPSTPRSRNWQVKATRDLGHLKFEIRDNGIGIETEYAQRFHSKEKYPGSGIGLSICKRIIDRHDGNIWVESSPGKGSSFFFTLPARVG